MFVKIPPPFRTGIPLVVGTGESSCSVKQQGLRVKSGASRAVSLTLVLHGPNRDSVLSESHEVQKGRGTTCDLLTVSSGEEKQQQQIIIIRV